MNEKRQPPPPEVIQRTVENWQEICRRLDALNELLDRTNDAFEAHILSNPAAAYRLRGIKPPVVENQE
jgi:hypothetical protein